MSLWTHHLISLKAADNHLGLQTPAPTCLLSSVNRVTRSPRALASHCVCGPGRAKLSDHLPVSFFIVDIYFCNYLCTSPSAEDDTQKLTPLLPSSGLLLLTHKHTDRRSNTQTLNKCINNGQNHWSFMTQTFSFSAQANIKGLTSTDPLLMF